MVVPFEWIDLILQVGFAEIKASGSNTIAGLTFFNLLVKLNNDQKPN